MRVFAIPKGRIKIMKLFRNAEVAVPRKVATGFLSPPFMSRKHKCKFAGYTSEKNRKVAFKNVARDAVIHCGGAGGPPSTLAAETVVWVQNVVGERIYVKIFYLSLDCLVNFVYGKFATTV